MNQSARPPMLGIRHVALYVADLAAAERFWVDVMGYAVEWRPDPDNVYLCGARDNLALHRQATAPAGRTRPAGPHRHRGGGGGRRRCLGRAPDRARGRAEDRSPRRIGTARDRIYFHGPEGLLVQIIHHSPMVA